MKANNIRNLKDDELQTQRKEMMMELIKLNAQVATGTSPKNTGQLKVLKKSLARIKTVINEKKGGIARSSGMRNN